jgi:hypothetical protein
VRRKIKQKEKKMSDMEEEEDKSKLKSMLIEKLRHAYLCNIYQKN